MKKNKAILIIFLVLIYNLCLSQSEVKLINGQKFTINTVSINDTIQTEFIEIYRNKKKLISHILLNNEGDYSSENIEIGDYDIIVDSIIFYSYWTSGDRMGKNIYPYGFRKQTYQVSNDGSLNLVKSELYIETYVNNWTTHKGMKYLFNAPNAENAKTLFKDYVAKAEKMYSGSFVFGKEKDNLEIEIREKLKNKISAETNYWEEVYGQNCKI